MGAPSKKVWELVHSLTPSENQKFYDRAFEHKRGKYSYYVTLYDALKELPEFDDQRLKDLLKDAPFLGYLHRVKNYLYDRILEFVVDARSDGERTVYDLLKRIKFLFEKRLYHHLPSHLNRAEKLVEELEDFKSHLKILHFQRELLKVGKTWGIFIQEIEDLATLERGLLAKEEERIELVQIQDQLFALPRIDTPKEVLEEIEKSLQQRPQPLSHSSQILIDRIRYNLAFHNQDFEQCLATTQSILQAFQQKPSLIQEYSQFKAFVMAAYYGANWSLYFNRYAKSDEFFGLIDSFGNASKREPILYLELKTMHELTLGIQVVDPSRILAAVQDYESLSGSLQGRITATKQVEIFHLCTVGLILCGEYKWALKYINLVQIVKPQNVRPVMRQCSKLLFILVHFELGNLDIVEQGIRSAKIAFKRRNLGNSFYQGVFQLFTQLAKLKPQQKQEAILTQFLEGFEPSDTNLWAQMNHYFNFEAWAIAHKTGRTFSEVLKEFNSAES